MPGGYLHIHHFTQAFQASVLIVNERLQGTDIENPKAFFLIRNTSAGRQKCRLCLAGSGRCTDQYILATFEYWFQCQLLDIPQIRPSLAEDPFLNTDIK